MRHLIHELPFERRLAAGQFTYHKDGEPTGAVESWRLTQAADDYRFLRVDLDGRASSGDSYLYHAVLTDAGQLERLTFRFWGQGVKVNGTVLLEDDGLTISREVSRLDETERLEEEIESRLPFWFPSTMGLGLLARQFEEPASGVAAVMLDVNDGFALCQQTIAIEIGQEEEVAVGRQTFVTRPCSINWPGQQRTVWISQTTPGWPLKMDRPDGLTAIARRFTPSYLPASSADGDQATRRIET